MTVHEAAQIVLRDMTSDDVHAAAELSFEQVWPHREEDWAMFLSIGEGVVAELDGKIVGSIIGWRFGDRFASIGLVIVTNAVQGKGVGRQLMEAMLKRFEGRTVMLNATAEGLPLYRKLGFVECGTICQHQAISPAQPLVALRNGERVRPMGAADGDALERLYTNASGMDRKLILDTFQAEGSTVVLCREHEQTGFAMLRRFGKGWAIAPVVAPDVVGAKALLAHWLGMQTGSFCRIDIAENSELGEWLAEIGLPEVGRVTCMALGPAPVPGDAATVFAIAAQALG